MTPSDPALEPYEVSDLEQIQALANPLRLRMLQVFAAGPPRTTKQVAIALGEKPTRLYHHVARLEKVGLIELTETRPKRGTIEKYYRAVARWFRMDPSVLQGTGPMAGTAEQVLARAAADMGTLAAQKAQESEDDGDDSAEGLVAALEIHGTAEQIENVRMRIDKLLQGLAADADKLPEVVEDGTAPQRLVIAWYPAPDKPPDGGK